MSWRLVNVDERKRLYSGYSGYDVPSLMVRRSLSVGNAARLIFELTDPPDVGDVRFIEATHPRGRPPHYTASHGPATGERMWVEIVDVRGERYFGKLESYPLICTALRHGEIVEFGPEHIADWEA